MCLHEAEASYERVPDRDAIPTGPGEPIMGGEIPRRQPALEKRQGKRQYSERRE